MPNAITKICHFCGSTNLNTVTNLIGMHWGSVTCLSCDRHLKWLSNPKITAEHDNRKLVIDAALQTGVNGWERLFLKSIRDRRWLTDKQGEKFDDICRKHKISAPTGEVRT